MQTIRTQTLQNQRGVSPQSSSFGSQPKALPTVKRHNSIPAKLSELQPIPPPLPPPRPKPNEAVIFKEFLQILHQFILLFDFHE